MIDPWFKLKNGSPALDSFIFRIQNDEFACFLVGLCSKMARYGIESLDFEPEIHLKSLNSVDFKAGIGVLLCIFYFLEFGKGRCAAAAPFWFWNGLDAVHLPWFSTSSCGKPVDFSNFKIWMERLEVDLASFIHRIDLCCGKLWFGIH